MMRELWRRLEARFGDRLALRPPATPGHIADAEAALGVRFPDSVRESFLVHDGQDDEPGVCMSPYAHRLGSLDSIVQCWRGDRTGYDDDPQRLAWLDRSGRVHQAHFHPGHIPLAGSTYWDYGRLLVDFSPAAAGTTGQIIGRNTDLEYVCEDFSGLLQQIADGLDAGTLVAGDEELLCLSPRARKPVAPARYFNRAADRRARSRRARSPRAIAPSRQPDRADA